MVTLRNVDWSLRHELFRLDDLPVNVEPAAGELQALYELRALSELPTGCVLEAGMNRHPVAEAPGIHHEVVHALGGRIDLDRSLHPHRAASSSRSSHSRSAFSTALSNEWMRKP